MGTIHDITLPIREGMTIYPGDPDVALRPFSRIPDGADANVTTVSFGTHTGTHLDAAHHFIHGAQTVDALPLARLIGPARVVEIPRDVTAIGPDALRRAGVEGATRVLLRTRNGDLLDRPGFQENHAHLTGAGAAYLVELGVELVAIDYLSVEAFDADEPHAHRAFLEREVVIVEGVDLRDVSPGDYELLCLPIKLQGLDGAPVRAVLRSLT